MPQSPERPPSRADRARGAGALLVVLVLSSLAGPSLAGPPVWQERYMEGVRAWEVGDYAASAAAMRDAIRGDGTEALRKFRFSSLNWEDYLPHCYLGLALEKLGQAGPALEELRESERQGAVKGKPRTYGILAAVVRRLEAAEKARLTASLPPTPTARPVPHGGSPPPGPATATPVPTATAPPAPTPRRAVPTPVPPVAKTAPPRSPLPTPPATRVPPPPTPMAPSPEDREALRDGVRAFLRADYPAAGRILRPLAGRLPGARLYLAYALAADYLRGGRRDAALRERAREEYKRARAEVAVVTPDSDLVSPAILAVLAGG